MVPNEDILKVQFVTPVLLCYFSISLALQHSSYLDGVHLFVNLYFHIIKHSVLSTYAFLLLQRLWVLLNKQHGIISMQTFTLIF